MKGVLLCGGEGTRLRPLTEVVNKHLLRVGELPMAEYPLRKLQTAGIQDVLIVSGGENFAAVVKYFGSGKKWGLRITHAIQDRAGGIAEALSLAEAFTAGERLVVILGDNFFEMELGPSLAEFAKAPRGTAQLYAARVPDPRAYGVFRYEDGQPVEIIEKPESPPSQSIAAGVYCYGPEVYGFIYTLRPSGRGELEISDVNNIYLRGHAARVVPIEGWWADCGTWPALHEAEERVKGLRS